jgi:hypothetical protein
VAERDEAQNFRGYIVATAGTLAAGLILLLVAVLCIDPFGLSPVSVTLPQFNTIKISRNSRDRLIKPYEAIRLHPRTVIIGTSRVKNAFDPDFVQGTPDFYPVYNAWIDSLKMKEARQLLEYCVREEVPIKHVVMELFFLQFGFAKWGTPLPIAQDPLADRVAATLSLSALQASVATIKASMASTNVVVMQRNGYLNIAGHHPGPGFASTKLTPWGMIPLDDEIFAELDKIISICAEADINLKLFIGPTHPAMSYVFWLSRKPTLREWLSRLSARANVISFLTAAEFRDYELDRKKPYYSDSAHISFAAAKLIVNDLVSYPHMQYGRLLDQASLPSILAEWDDQFANWGNSIRDMSRPSMRWRKHLRRRIEPHLGMRVTARYVIRRCWWSRHCCQGMQAQHCSRARRRRRCIALQSPHR